MGVLAGCLSGCAGEQASGRVDVFGRDLKQQAAAALKQTIESGVDYDFADPRKAVCLIYHHGDHRSSSI